MTETKGTYKLYELSDRLSEIQDILYNLEGVDIPADLHRDYLNLLEELDQTNSDFTTKVDSISSLIQSRKKWLQIRKEECARLQQLVKKDEKSVEWLQKYLKEHLEKLGVKKLSTKRFNLSIRKASVAPLKLKYSDASMYPKKYQKVTVEVDKKFLKEDVKNSENEALKYAELGEKSTYLSIK